MIIWTELSVFDPGRTIQRARKVRDYVNTRKLFGDSSYKVHTTNNNNAKPATRRGHGSHGFPLRQEAMDPPGTGILPVKNLKDSTDESCRDENDESQNDAPSDDEFAQEDTPIRLEPDTPNAGEAPGFDPYDSGTFDTSKSWYSHSKFKRTF